MKFYQVDAFCKDLFSGNPAGVCPMEYWPEDGIMQNIAMENNLAETAFCVWENDHYHIRWFTPAVEVDLCGHATLAAAHVFFEHENYQGDTITFNSRSGELRVKKENTSLTLDFPVDDWKLINVTSEMFQWFSLQPLEAYRGKTDYLLIFPSESDIANISPNLPVIERLTEVRGVIASAKGDNVDFVSRFFAPQSGIPEDPVTGSAHTTLTPYWSQKLNKNTLEAIQLSPRKGYLNCVNDGNRIKISGKARTYLSGQLLVGQLLSVDDSQLPHL
jgi:PhzF family phenazine biosynthesis protein